MQPYISRDSRYYVWWFPGSPIRAHLSLDVISQLHQQVQLRTPDAVTHGFLFGRAGEGLTEIIDFTPAIGGADGLSADASRTNGHILVGYYRVESGDKLRLNDADLALAQTFLSKRYQVILLIQPNAFGPPNASFFFHGAEGRISPFSLMEFPFDPSALAAEERAQWERSHQPAARQSVAELPSRSARHERHLIRPGYAVAVICALLALSVGVKAVIHGFSGRWLALRTARVEPPTSALSALSMGLHANSQNKDVLITWNRESPVITAATTGVLSVEDGATKRDIPLSAFEVHNSSIIYVPVGSRVVVRLAITTPVMSVAESLVVILPQK
jgi:hypothetical protein